LRSDSSSLLLRLRCSLLLGVALLLAACSAGVKLGYNYADTFLLYTIDGYVGLTPEQDALVRERSATLISWHRSTQLRDYAQLLDSTRRKLATPVTPTDVLQFNAAVNARLAALGDKAAPDLAQLALTLTPEQIARVERKLAGENSKARRELVQFAGKETLEDRVKKYAERAEFWFGSLSKEQLEIVRATLAKRPSNAAWWQDERERRQRDMVALLQKIRSERPPEATATAWLRAYFAQLQLPPEAERRRSVEEFRAANAELVAQLVNAATPEQKATLERKLAAFAEDLVALAAVRAAQPPG
jgi:hypothetical protein